MNGVLQQSGSGIAEPLSAVAQWEFDVRHATNGLSIKVCGLGDGPPVGLALAHGLWSLYWRRPVLRVVLELSDLKFSSPQVTLELVLFNRWIGKRGGVVRLCGLSREQLQSSRLYRWFCYYPDHEAAVRDGWPIRRPR